MKLYPTRYQAKKEAPSSSYVVVKVCGGYVFMTPLQYAIWKNQK